jgi:hypothetical protein
MMGYKKKNRNVPVKREIFFPHTLNLLINFEKYSSDFLSWRKIFI